MEPQEEHNEAEKGKRNMERLFDLQVFAQENTQTTGGLSAEMKTYYGMELGMTDGFMQQKSSAKEEYTPPFNLEGL